MVLEPAVLDAHGVMAGRVLAKTRSDGEVPERLMNVTGAEARIPRGTIVGHLWWAAEDEELRYEDGGPRVNTLTAAEGDNLLASFDLSHLRDDEARKVREFLSRHLDVFYREGTQLGCTRRVQHRIETGDARPIAVAPYREPHYQRDVLRKEIAELERQEIVRPSSSPWSAPVVMVKKKPSADGKEQWRVCVDWRRLNAVTKRDFYPLPNFQETLDQLDQTAFFSTCDMASGYYLVAVHEQDIEKTAFSTPDGHWEFTRMGMGLVNSPATWQRLMNATMSGLSASCLVYLDDVVCFSGPDIDEHLRKHGEVFARVRDAGLYLKPAKCQFLRRETKYFYTSFRYL